MKAMAAAANYAWCNRQGMTHQVRCAFSKVFGMSADDLEMHLVYDVSHNMAKFEEHVSPFVHLIVPDFHQIIDGKPKQLLVHRKGSTRAFAPNHPMIPDDYKSIGQPVIIGGTMRF